MNSNLAFSTLEQCISSANTGLDAIKRAPIVDRDTGIKCIRIQDISQSKENKNWGNTEVTPENFKKFQLIKDDILIARTGGSIGVNRYISENKKAVFNNGLIRIRVDKRYYYPKFVYYLLQTELFKQHINAIAFSTAAQPNMKIRDLLRFEFLDLDLNKQIYIADLLTGFDKKIALNHQINQTLEQMAQALFKSWFVDFDPVKAKIAVREAGGTAEQANLSAMQVISGETEAQLEVMKIQQPKQYKELKAIAELFPDAMQDCELGDVPLGWILKPLYETAEYVNGAAFKATDFTADNSGLPIIKIAELKKGISAGTKFTNNEVKSKYFIDNEDVLYSWSGSPETSLEVFKWHGGKGWLNQHIFKLNFSSEKQKHFTYFLLKQMKPLLIRTAQQKQTTGLGHITVADMKRIKVIYPCNEILRKFSKTICPIYEQSSSLIREVNNLSKLRDTLLPKLISGELAPSKLDEMESLSE